MELINKAPKVNPNEVTTELQQKQKQEYKMIGRYWINKSLKLFQYNPTTQEISFVERERERDNKGTIYLVEVEGKLVAKDLDYEKAQVDPRMIFFEAMNINTAQKRVDKWKQGKVKELCNLREITGSKIKFW